MTKITTIIFDLGGVILNLDQDRTLRAFKRLGADLDLMNDVSTVFKDFETGRITADDFRNAIITHLKGNVTAAQVDDAWNAMLLDLPVERLTMLENLRKKYRVFLLSNTNSIHIDAFNLYLKQHHPNLNWFDRTDKIKQLIENGCYPEHVRFLEHIPSSEIDLEVYKSKILNMGGEGVVIRNPYSTYKSGRSGIHNPELQKVKSYFDDEFIVVGYTQLETNKNEAFLNEVGYTKRSTSKIGKSKVEALGSIIVTKEGTCFSVGSGFTFEERIMLWKIRDTLLGKYAKIKYTSYSYKNVPLQPIFICFRNKIDM